MSSAAALNIPIGISGIICTILILIAIITDVINKRKSELLRKASGAPTTSRVPNAKKKFWVRILLILTNFALYSFLIHTFSVSLIRFNIYPQTHLFCRWLATVNTAIYHCTRYSLYLVLITRIHVSFNINDSAYSYSKKYVIFPLLILLIINFILALAADFLLPAEAGIDGYYDEEIEACAPIFGVAALAVNLLNDLFFCTVLLILFIRPLIKLQGMRKAVKLQEMSSGQRDKSRDVSSKLTITTNTSTKSVDTPTLPSAHSLEPALSHSEAQQSPTSTNDAEVDDRMNRIRSMSMESKKKKDQQHKFSEFVVRYAVCVIVAICSTLLLMFTVGAINSLSDLLSPWDNATNVWCIILINKYNTKIYNKLCCGPSKCIKCCCKFD
mmetsp:Transcript_51821/g.46520  ORF Transcript_51821/g.46520 Transcript_51821/m.46520 type:complete len:384 (+) Transcript_51821:27-1178(+)